MLSNLIVKSNLIEKLSNECLARISALELRTIDDRLPVPRKFFDESTRHNPNHILPTEKQNKEWDARLFWGDKRVSMEDEGRRICWLDDLAAEVFPNWERCCQKLNLEEAFEWEWLCLQLEKNKSKWCPRARRILTEIQNFLQQKGVSNEVQRQKKESLSER
jgi:hypothetical protein